MRAYLNWLHREGHLPDKPRVELLKFEHKVIATFTPEHVERMIGFKPTGTNQTRVHVAMCLMLDTGLRLREALANYEMQELVV